MNTKYEKSEAFELPPSAEEFDELNEDVIEDDDYDIDTNMSPEQEANLPPIDNTPEPKPQKIEHKSIKAKMENGKLIAVDEPIESDDEQLPLIEETNDNTQDTITEVEVDETDKLKFNILQLDMKNMELESKVLEQKYQRQADAANLYIQDLKRKYEVGDDWKYNPTIGNFIKS